MKINSIFIHVCSCKVKSNASFAPLNLQCLDAMLQLVMLQLLPVLIADSLDWIAHISLF